MRDPLHDQSPRRRIRVEQAVRAPQIGRAKAAKLRMDDNRAARLRHAPRRSPHVHGLAGARELRCDLMRVVARRRHAAADIQASGNESCGPIRVETPLHDVGPLKTREHSLAASRSHRRCFVGVRRKPLEARSQRCAVARFHDEPADAVFDDLRHACDTRADDRRRARHRFEQRLPEQLGHVCVLPIRSAIDARQHQAQRPPVHFHERGIAESMMENDRFPRRLAFSDSTAPVAFSGPTMSSAIASGSAAIRSATPLCGSRRPTNNALVVRDAAGSGLNFTVSTPPRITRAHGLSS